MFDLVPVQPTPEEVKEHQREVRARLSAATRVAGLVLDVRAADSAEDVLQTTPDEDLFKLVGAMGLLNEANFDVVAAYGLTSEEFDDLFLKVDNAATARIIVEESGNIS